MIELNDGNGKIIKVNFSPDSCPICNTGISALYIKFHHQTFYSRYAKDGKAQIVWKCPKLNCNSIFLSDYYMDQTEPESDGFKLRKTYPKTPIGANWPNEVGKISPNFITIYDQATIAETTNLDQIAGIGFRRSLEFLVKDFCVSQKPNKTEEIRKMQLAQCIQENIDDLKIKECAKRAAWLGNDETHYTRKWENKDIVDLKTLIRLTVYGIEAQLLLDNYISEMEDPKNKK